MSNLCYFNGKILPFKNCNLHISDLILQRGFGVFDFFRTRNEKIMWLDDYINRLFNSMAESNIDIELSKSDFKSIIFELQNKNGFKNSSYKAIISGGYSSNLESVPDVPNIIIINKPFVKPNESFYHNGTALITYNFARSHPEVKTLNYYESLRLHKKLKEFNAIDVLYHQNVISETSRANIFFIKNGKVFTPLNNILDGIIRKQILSISDAIKLDDISFEELFDFDEIFITSSSKDVMPIVNINGRKIKDGKVGPITKDFISEFESLVS